jgi:hypothetical protein
MMTPDEIEQEIARAEQEIADICARVERLTGRQVGRIDYYDAWGTAAMHMRDWRPTDDN